MMLKNLSTVSLFCLGLTISSATADAVCAPNAVGDAIDTYSTAPYGARAWRVLNGLGDPKLEAEGGYSGSWAATEAWQKLVTEIAPENMALQQVGYDCRVGYPLQVLQERTKTLGKFSKYVKQWLHTQGKVFEVCANPAIADVALPAAAEIHPALAQMQADDRAYQEASIAFYHDKPKAIELFRAIGASQSPHRGAARYNVANLLANAKNVVDARKEVDAILADASLSDVHAIAEELLGFIANVEDTADGWTKLIDQTVSVLSKPAAEISASVPLQKSYARALYDIDFAGVTRKRDDWWLEGKLPPNPTISKAVVDASRKHPMAVWMMAGQSADYSYQLAPWSLVGEKWNARMTTLLDRSLALAPSGQGVTGLPLDVLNVLKADASDASRAQLWGKVTAAIKAAETSCGDAPETAAVGQMLLHAVRLSAMAGQFEEIYTALEAAPFKSARTYYGMVLPKLTGYLLAEGNWEEGRKLRDRLLTPAFFSGLPAGEREYLGTQYANFMMWVAEDDAHWNSALALSNAKLEQPILNLLPIKSLWELSDNATMNANQKALLSRAAWTRGYALGKTPADDDTKRMLAANPQIAAAFAQTAKDFPNLTPQRQRLLTILRNPRFGILLNTESWGSTIETPPESFAALDQYDHNDKNWWCPLEPDRQLANLRVGYDNLSGMEGVNSYYKETLTPVLEPALLERAALLRDKLLQQNPMAKAINWKEVAALSKVGSAPKQLAEGAVRWAKSSKGDDGAPEALALAVQATRYGCNWHGRHGTYSKAAQTLLTTKFGATSWAAKTPYWFDCMRREWDKDYNKVAVCEAKTWPKQAPLK